MANIEIADTTHGKLQLLAAAWGMDEGQAVAELINRFSAAGKPKPAPSGDVVAIHFDYRGDHVEGEYRRSDKSVTVTSGTVAGQRFVKPSPAARAVVSSIDPKVNPHRNGWAVWTVTETGEPLQSIRST